MPDQLNFPSRDFWTITPFKVDVPDGWTARQTVEHLVFLEHEADPLSQCGIAWQRVPATLDLRRHIQINHLALKRHHPDVTVAFSKFGRLTDRVAYLRVAEMTVEGRGRTGQVYSAFCGPRFESERPVELIEITGTFPAAERDRMTELIGFVDSFRFRLVGAEAATTTPSFGTDDIQAKGA